MGMRLSAVRNCRIRLSKSDRLGFREPESQQYLQSGQNESA